MTADERARVAVGGAGAHTSLFRGLADVATGEMSRKRASDKDDADE